MALFTPIIAWEQAANICKIPRAEDGESFTNYLIEIKVSPYKWTVSRRYKQFVDLHEKLTKDYTINKSLLPPKKLFGNRSETFINERRKGLELYLQLIIHQFSILPESLALFLDFQKYEVRTICADLSEIFYSKGEEILAKNIHEFTPLHLHAITERLQLGEPTYSNDPKKDIAHLVEFITQLQHVIIVGNPTYFGSSNIIPNKLSFDLSWFKNMLILEILNCNLENTLSSAETLRPKLRSLVIHKTLNDISSILLCGIIHWCPVTHPVHTWPFWSNLTSINFSNNKITKIHSSIKLLSSVKNIDLSHNEIRTIENMETLSELTVLNLSHNKIQDVDYLHTRLGNIHSLNLSTNKIKNLQGFCKLFSISELYLENNLISSIGEITYLSKLPCLEILNFQNNPVTLTVDYRPQVLLLFGSLAPELVLDGLKATEKEIDTVSILQALKQARGDTSPFMDHNLPEEEISSKNNNHSSQVSKYQEQNSPGITSKQIMNDIYQSSKFRQQIESLRKIGGTDWLRLLNEMHNVKVKTDLSSVNDTDIEVLINDISLQKEGICNEEKISSEVSSTLIENLINSFEISYSDWLLSLDASSLQLDHQFPDLHLNGHTRNEYLKLSNWPTIVKNAKLIWAVLIDHQENLMYEVPICILVTHCEIVFLQLKRLSKVFSIKNPNRNISPEFLYSKSVSPNSIISLSIGPFSAYVELKIKNNHDSENIILTMDPDTIGAFVLELGNLHNIMPFYKMNPFAKNLLEIETITTNFSLSEISVQKQILFGQRVCVSKALHKCQLGILHYVFITPSHIVLVEEKLQFPLNACLDTMTHPQFRICSLINIHTNIKQINLKDINNFSDIVNSLYSSNQENLEHRYFLEKEKKLDILYKLGSWLLIEFDSKLSLYLKFFNLKQRNNFLDIFLSVRNQR